MRGASGSHRPSLATSDTSSGVHITSPSWMATIAAAISGMLHSTTPAKPAAMPTPTVIRPMIGQRFFSLRRGMRPARAATTLIREALIAAASAESSPVATAKPTMTVCIIGHTRRPALRCPTTLSISGVAAQTARTPTATAMTAAMRPNSRPPASTVLRRCLGAAPAALMRANSRARRRALMAKAGPARRMTSTTTTVAIRPTTIAV